MVSDDPSGSATELRARYDAGFPKVADAPTVYIWREPAFYLVRWARRSGVQPVVVTSADAVFFVLVFCLFWTGHYWWGVLGGFLFGLAELTGSMLARCGGARSKAGDMLANVLNLAAPPLWWWAWEHGLAAWGRPLAPIATTMVLLAIIGGYAADRGIEALFMQRFDGLPLDHWTRIDSRFRLVAAGRNIDLMILAAALLFGRPDTGLVLVAWWTIASGIFHAVRLARASELAARGKAVTSWLDE